MAVYQNLYVDEVAGSVDVNANTSEVRILWTSQQTNDSRNEYRRTAYFWISINGGAETGDSITYTLPLQTTETILELTFPVEHREDGSATVSVRTWMDTDISAGVVELSNSATLTTIPRPSVIDYTANVTLGNACSVRWTPKSSAFRYKLKFSLGNWTYTTGAIHPNTTAAYTYTGYQIPMDVAWQIPKSTGAMTVTLHTYSNSEATAQVGAADSKTFTVTVPDNADTKPTVHMVLSPVSSLPSKFGGLYIQGKTQVRATTLTADPKYGASISSYSVNVGGTGYDVSSAYTSDFLLQYGIVYVSGYATDSRTFTGSTSQTISVIPYSKPKILPADDEEWVIASRCDHTGKLTDEGKYLKIKAKCSCSPVDGKNTCSIRYRLKTEDRDYGEWTTILDGSAGGDTVTTDALEGTLDANATYFVQVGVVDDIGETNFTTITVPTAKVYCHRDGARRSFTFGGYVEDDNTFAIASDISFKPMGGISRVAMYDSNDFNDLNRITAYYGGASAPGTVGCVNYPVNKTGVLEVISQMFRSVDTGEWWGFAWQTYRAYDGDVYMRSYFTDIGWTPWKMLTMT